MAGNLALGILLVNWDLIIIILVDKPISMGSESKTTSYRSEVIRSPTIYTQEFIAQEEVGGRNHRSFGGTRIKSIIVPKVHWLLLHTPIVIAIAPVRLAVLLLRALLVAGSSGNITYMLAGQTQGILRPPVQGSQQ